MEHATPIDSEQPGERTSKPVVRKAGLARRIASGIVVGLSFLYALLLLGWVAVHALVGDTRWWSFLLNTFALYLFTPLIAIVPLSVVMRRTLLRASAIWGLLLFLITYGSLLIPPALRASPPANAPRLTVMTFNVHSTNYNSAAIVAALRRSKADIVGMQEVNATVGQALHDNLADLYPYQVAGEGGVVHGDVILSRYPVQTTGYTLQGDWSDDPLAVHVNFQGHIITVLVVHPISTLLTRNEIRGETAARAETAQSLVDFVRVRTEPIVVLTDFNATDQSTPYRMATQVLGDAWREGGFGFGLTFPGDTTFEGSRPRVRQFYIPQWIVRIDYVFHTPQWQTVEAHIGPWDGASDHRPVVATLALVDPTALTPGSGAPLHGAKPRSRVEHA